MFGRKKKQDHPSGLGGGWQPGEDPLTSLPVPPPAADLTPPSHLAPPDAYGQSATDPFAGLFGGNGQTFGNGAMFSWSSTPNVQIIDARNNPQLREQIMMGLRMAGIDPQTWGGWNQLGGMPGQQPPAGTINAPQTPDGAQDPVDQIAQLAELHKAGALTDEEFQAAKTRLLGEL